MSYPTFEELNTAPDFLLIGACAIEAMRAIPGFFNKAPTVRELSPDERREYDRNQRAAWQQRNHTKSSTPRTYKSRYVGVTVHRNRWLAQWGPKGSIKSAVFALNDAGELQAAWARAKALGLSAPELRPADVLIVAPEPAPAIEPHGPAKRRLGGQRIA